MAFSSLTLARTSLVGFFLLGASAAAQPSIAVITVREGDVAGNHPGYLATFSGTDLPKQDLAVLAPEDSLGCDVYKTDVSAGFVAVVQRGNCTFWHKAEMAKQGGAKGVIIYDAPPIMAGPNETNGTAEMDASMGIFVLGVDKLLGEQLRNASLAKQETNAGPVMMAVKPYESSLLNISELILICLATFLVGLGAVMSTSDLNIHPKSSLQTALAPPEEEVLEVDHWGAMGFFVLGSCALVFLFFFMQYLIYVVMFGFCFGGASCMAQIGAVCIGHAYPALKNHAMTLPLLGALSHADVVAGIPAVIVVLCWVTLRNTPYGWPFQDIIGSCFLVSLQRTIKLPNIKIATILLCAMFFFDIFWVFISPLFFHQSVMVSVATGGGTGESVPMLLRIPAVGDAFGNDRLLGFGDIALPGLLVSYLRRHDLLSSRSCKAGYFLPSLVGYFVGLNLTIAALCIMRMGQPALLYLVPGTLGTTLVLAKMRGEVGFLWEGVPVKTEDSRARHADGV